MKFPLLPPLLAYALGVLLSRYASWRPAEALACALLFAALAVVAGRWANAWVTPCLLLALVPAGTLMAILHEPGAAPKLDAGADEVVLLEGCVVESPVMFEGRTQFTMELAPHARARVTLAEGPGEGPLNLHYGQRVEIEAKARPPRNFGNPGSFDYAGFLARQQVYWNAAMRRGTKPKLLEGRCGSRAAAMLSRIREAGLERLERLYPDDAFARGLFAAILFGERRELDKVWQDDFRRAGTYHVLVIAGLHLAAFTGFLLFLMRLCFVPEIPALAITCGAAWFYVAISGGNTPVLRAAGGFTLYLAARYFSRRPRLINLLAGVALAFLIADPAQLFEPAFQLSFLAVASIGALAAPVLEATSGPYLSGLSHINDTQREGRMAAEVAQFRVELRLLAEAIERPPLLDKARCARLLALWIRAPLAVWELVAVSAAMQVGLALPMAIYFHRVSLSGLSANVLVVPLMALVVPFGLSAVVTGWRPVAAVAGWLVTAAGRISIWHARVGPDWRVPDPPVWLSAAFVAALIGLALALGWTKLKQMRPAREAALAAVAILFGVIVWSPLHAAKQRGVLELTAIDVGQGDSLLVRFPGGQTMVVDGGGIPAFRGQPKPRLDIGEDVVAPYLWRRGIRSLDYLAMTHAHADHAGGLGALMEDFHPAQFWVGANSDNAEWKSLREHAARLGIAVIEPGAGRSFEIGGARVEVLAPAADYRPGDEPSNDDSLVLRIVYGERAFLLTGDAGGPTEARLVAEGAPVRADVLKVGHHGSRTSSTEAFLDAVQPSFALISDGKDNPFHHPNPAVVARLAARHVSTYRTDEDGLIDVRTDGYRIWVSDNRDEPGSELLPP